MSDFVIAQIRTYVPMAVGSFVVWLANWGFDVVEIEATLVPAVVALVSAAYYLAVRLLSGWKPSLGILLGVNTQPSYEDQ